jgi:hypothetical protein
MPFLDSFRCHVIQADMGRNLNKVDISKNPFEGSSPINVVTAYFNTSERYLDSAVSLCLLDAKAKLLATSMVAADRLDLIEDVDSPLRIEEIYGRLNHEIFSVQEVELHSKSLQPVKFLGGRLAFSSGDADYSPTYPIAIQLTQECFTQDLFRFLLEGGVDYVWNLKGKFWFTNKEEAALFKLTFKGS